MPDDQEGVFEITVPSHIIIPNDVTVANYRINFPTPSSLHRDVAIPSKLTFANKITVQASITIPSRKPYPGQTEDPTPVKRRNIHKRLQTDEPLQEFHFFLHLPPEIRMQIWAHCAHHPRLIELEWGASEGTINGQKHTSFRVNKSSRAPPAIVSVCFEARGEATKFYLPWMIFWSRSCKKLMQARKMEVNWEVRYFNTRSDIILLGQRTCMRTFVELAHLTNTCHSGNGFAISRIAFFVSKKPRRHGLRFEGCMDVSTWPVGRGITPLTELDQLHGLDSYRSLLATDKKKLASHAGFDGLPDVFMVLDSDLWHREHEAVDQNMAFRPADPLAAYTLNKHLRLKALQAQILKLKSNNVGYLTPQSRWAGDKHPDFHVVSLAPVPENGYVVDNFPPLPEREYVSNSIPHKDLFESGIQKHFRKQELDSRYMMGCKLNLRFHPDGRLYHAVGLYGTTENVRKAKEEMARRVAGRDRWSFWGLPGIIKKAL